MSKSYFFRTGLEGKDTIQAYTRYCKDAGGYIVSFQVGDSIEPGLFGWHIDADYFNFYQRHDRKLLVPAGRRSAKKEQEADALMEQNALAYVREFAALSEQLGAPHMEIAAA